MNKRRKAPPELPGHTHEAEQAKKDGVKLSTLRKYRSQGRGQAYIRHFRQVYYVDADRPRYLESLKVPPVRSERVTAAPIASRKLMRHHEETTNP
jgi:hypothetical protein